MFQYSNIYPTRFNVTQFILSGNCSTCFAWYHHPSSGAHTTVSTASDICHIVTATCRYRGRVGTLNVKNISSEFSKQCLNRSTKYVQYCRLFEACWYSASNSNFLNTSLYLGTYFTKLNASCVCDFAIREICNRITI